ncbi:MAG: hypothetical protein RL226_246, partial [Bacteroidota bacterium]
PLDEVKEAFEADLLMNPNMSGKNHFYRWYEFMFPRIYPSQDWTVLRSNYADAMTDLPVRNSQRNGSWVDLGPDNWTNSAYAPGNGRLNFVTTAPSNNNSIYVGAPAGGIWKSTNGGNTWSPLTDSYFFGGVSAIAIDPTNENRIYIGTGDQMASDTEGRGVYVSEDGGLTWSSTGLYFEEGDGAWVSRILIHPDNNQILLAATNQGIFRSANAGLSWENVRNGSFKDMAFKPNDPNIVYAARPDMLFKSTDNGQNFSSVTNGLPAPSSVGRIALAVTPANAEYVYLVIADDTAYGLLGVYRSTDSGESFTLRADSPNILDGSEDGNTSGGQAWYDLAIGVNPSNANDVLVGGINLWRSTNGGSSWDLHAYWVLGGNPHDYVHADVHHIYATGGLVFVGSDGGIYRGNWSNLNFTDISDGLSISQCYHVDVDPNDPDRVVTGLQDNGTMISDNNDWIHIQGGDGMVCFFDPTNSDRVYMSAQFGAFYVSENGGLNTDWAAEGIDDNGAWTTPWIYDPSNPGVMFAGFTNVWKRNGLNANWTQVSFNINTTLRKLAMSEASSSIIYAASYTDLFKSENGGTTWTEITVPTPGVAMSDILVSPDDANHLWISHSGFTAGNKIFESFDGGASWTNVSLGLPNLPVNALAFDPINATIYAGTDFGVWMLNPQLAGWQEFSDDLPRTIVNDLVYHNSGQLYAGTYGRGVWRSPVFLEPEGLPEALFTCSDRVVCPGTEVFFSDLSLDHFPSWQWTFEGADITSSQEQHPSVVYSTPGTYNVSLTVQNANGSSVYSVENAIVVLPEAGVEQGSLEEFNLAEYWDYSPKENNRWEWNSEVGYLDNTSIFVENYLYNENQVHEIISPTFDLSDAASTTAEEGALMTMAFAFTQISPDNDDRLRLFFSTDCGETWALIKQWRGTTDLPTASNSETYFAPTDQDWNIASFEITNPVYFNGSFRYKFYFESDNGNNVFIDRVQFSNLTGIEEAKAFSFTVAPQPADNQCTVTLQSPLNQGRLEVFDMTGKLVKELPLTKSLEKATFDTSDLPVGQYILKLVGSETVASMPLLIVR